MTAQPQPTGTSAQPPSAPRPDIARKRTRISAAWVAVICFAVILLVLLVFILENNQEVNVAFFGTHSRLPLGVAMLLAAVCGLLLGVFAATLRIIQLRTAARRHLRAQARTAAVTRPPADPR